MSTPRCESPGPAAGSSSSTLAPLDNRALANLCGPLDANLHQIEAALDVAIAHRSGSFTLTGTSAQTARAAEAIERFYAQAGEAAVGRRHPARPDRDCHADSARMRRPPRTPCRCSHAPRRRPARPHAEPVALPQEHPGARHHVRHRPGRHRQDLPCRRLRRRRARARRREAARPRASRRRGRRAARASCRATSRRRSTPTCARCTTRSTTSWASRRPASSSSAARSRSRRSRTCAGARSTTRSSSSTRRRTRRPSR